MKSNATAALPAADNLLWSRIVMWVCVVAVACLPLGVIWDTSWHISIGRDTFWAPPHIVIQLGGVIPALLFAWQAARTTFRGTTEQRAASVAFCGARASFGAWIAIWGAVAMLTSAPFDDWWHNTYGLDVKIVSVPHALLGFGMFAVALGVQLFVLSVQNRASGCDRGISARLFVLASGLVVTLLSFYATEFTWPNQQHSARFYQLVSILYPFVFAAIARASSVRWPATRAAFTYMGIMMAVIWLLPLFPAQPKLAPIYNPVDHMVPPPFPMLMFVPALAIDLFMRVWGKPSPGPALAPTSQESIELGTQGFPRRSSLKDWLLAPIMGGASLFLALATQWYFAKFLISPAADNWFFAGNRMWPYFVELGDWTQRFWDLDKNPLTIRSLMGAAILAAISARLGLWCGTWMLKVKR